ncbi:hypothetical protein ACJX0J_032038, partial [Zea mays]
MREAETKVQTETISLALFSLTLKIFPRKKIVAKDTHHQRYIVYPFFLHIELVNRTNVPSIVIERGTYVPVTSKN